MKCSCERDALFRALTICADLSRAFPETFQVTLRAHAGGEGSLDVLLWGEDSGVGLLATVPAEIVEAGSVTVPTCMTASALAVMPQGHLSLSSIVIPDPELVPDEELIKPIKGGPALLIEGTSETGATQRPRLRLCTPISEHAGPPALTEWRRRGIPLASIAPSALREAWEPCVLLAKERVEVGKGTPDMDHALVLFRFDQHALVCTATTQIAVAQSTFSWTRLPGEAPFSHALVDECMLRWIMTTLKGKTEPVTLTLVPQEAPATLLLFSLPQFTLVCRGKTTPLPLVWERRVGAPSTHALLLVRSFLVKALDFLSAMRFGDADRYVLVHVANRRLWLQWDPLVQADHAAMCWLPIVNAVADTSPVLVHLQHMRRIIRLLKGPAISLELGTMMLRHKQRESVEPVPVGFVRFSKPADASAQIMLAIAKRSSFPPNAERGSAHQPDAQKEEEKGDALATV